MYSRTKRMLIAVILALSVAIAASAAPEGRRESGDWIGQRIDRIVVRLMKLFAKPYEDPVSIPPKP